MPKLAPVANLSRLFLFSVLMSRLLFLVPFASLALCVFSMFSLGVFCRGCCNEVCLEISSFHVSHMSDLL